jgi:hypothetical protein
MRSRRWSTHEESANGLSEQRLDSGKRRWPMLLGVGGKGRTKRGVIATRGPFIGGGGWAVGGGASTSATTAVGELIWRGQRGAPVRTSSPTPGLAARWGRNQV